MAPVMAHVTITERLEGVLEVGVAATRISCARQSDTSATAAHRPVAHHATPADGLDGPATLR
jgi:hypothetical protein